MDDVRIEPFAFACFALDVAGFDTAPINEQAFAQIDEAGAFELVFDLLQDYELSLGYDADDQRYRVAVTLVRPAGLQALMSRALSAHHDHPRATRRYSVDNDRQLLTLVDSLDASGADPVDLAEIIADVVMAMLDFCKVPVAPEPSSAAATMAGFLRV